MRDGGKGRNNRVGKQVTALVESACQLNPRLVMVLPYRVQVCFAVYVVPP